MNVAVFSVFTIAGTALWNGVLIGLGASLGTQYILVQQYSQYLNSAVYAVFVGLVVGLIVRSVRRRRADVRSA
jgi:membrane protein DedA with SNARE-associated domain